MTPSPGPSAPRQSGAPVLAALACLYTAQGIPFGFATEYLPVVLREQGYTYTAIAALAWLQLPWQLKVLWAKLADSPTIRPRSRPILLFLQLGLSATVAAFAIRPLSEAPALWFGLTAAAAALAATQDVFVDAFAVRALAPSARGFGNTAQVAGYRLGMLIGGSALLLLVGRFGERWTLLGCAALVAGASVGAFAGRREERAPPPQETEGVGTTSSPAPLSTLAMLRHMLGRETWRVLALAATFKLGLHMASALLKPMAVDFGWTKQEIGYAVVLFGSAGALAGAGAGGALHRRLGEARALRTALLVQAAVCLPLVVVERLHAPRGLTTAIFFVEHFGSGLGTTILFAALMSATRPADAGLHYTVLTSANAVAIGASGFAGGLVADHFGKLAAFLVATLACLAPVVLLPGWTRAARASNA